ncbi:AgmX/PglI C-terminal domain-containing protein [Sandaracinus amylolyticus]|uniref:AgmX/PglI C-terminal domain-containing protein n=1 Tax=Sandaracinus amylolyticus TaxID=927083 RepID=UPI001F270C09|nr:AgmX/PglI C-terminal domain-containing protein [Sandaracinus amylolyticus]UJR84729.1 Hypothetical protein I5071_68080 [Sandaracinus amylolyticus]
MIRSLRIVLGALSLVTLVACGSAPSRSVAPRPRRATAVASGAIQPGAVYTIDHDVEERLDGALQRVRHTRVVLWIGARRADGAYDATATLTRQQEGAEEIARAVVALQLAPDGTLRRDPDLLCDRADDDLFAARFIRHVIAPYPRANHSELFVEQREQPLVARTRAVAEGMRAEATLALDQDPLALVHATGDARVRVIADLDAVDPMAFDVRTRIEGTPTVRDESASVRPREVRIDERTRSARAQIRRAPPTSCEDLDREEVAEGDGDFDVRVVIRMIQTRQAQIRACYERELRERLDLEGRVKISMTIEESGDVTNVRVVERTIPGPPGEAIGECIVRVVRGFRFRPGPEGGRVTYQFPFVFEPQ